MPKGEVTLRPGTSESLSEGFLSEPDYLSSMKQRGISPHLNPNFHLQVLSSSNRTSWLIAVLHLSSWYGVLLPRGEQKQLLLTLQQLQAAYRSGGAVLSRDAGLAARGTSHRDRRDGRCRWHFRPCHQLYAIRKQHHSLLCTFRVFFSLPSSSAVQ